MPRAQPTPEILGIRATRRNDTLAAGVRQPAAVESQFTSQLRQPDQLLVHIRPTVQTYAPRPDLSLRFGRIGPGQRGPL